MDEKEKNEVEKSDENLLAEGLQLIEESIETYRQLPENEKVSSKYLAYKTAIDMAQFNLDAIAKLFKLRDGSAGKIANHHGQRVQRHL